MSPAPAPAFPYRGRFAPTPSGELHIGSAVAAVASYLEARRRGGEWHVRIDDLDRPRVVPGAADHILRELERLGLRWDGPVVHQSERAEAYRDAADSLRGRGLAFPCGCTRREAGTGPYPGWCRDGLPPGRRARSLRLRVHGTPAIKLRDRVQGELRLDVAATLGDFVLVRADGIHAYHLATVVDDQALGATEVVRGADLLDSTGAQVVLAGALGLAAPAYAHVPVACDAAGAKLAKATRAAPTAASPATDVLRRVLGFLGQDVRDLERAGSAEALLESALPRWSLAGVPRARSAPLA